MIRRLFFTLAIVNILCIAPLKSQNTDLYGIGDWQYHLPYSSAKEVIEANERIYVLTDVSLFYFDKTDQSLTKLSKLDGLSENKFGSINFHNATNTLVIGYQNGQIDLIKEGKITGIDAILRSNIVGSKKINHILFQGNNAFISCDFGVVLLDLNKQIIKETYRNIGANGAQVFAYNAITTNDSIFVASSEGLIATSLSNNVNRLDFNNWRRSFTGIPSNKINKVSALNDTLFAVFNDKEIYSRVSYTEWKKLPFVPDATVRGFKNSNNQIGVSVQFDFRIFTISSSVKLDTIFGEKIAWPMDSYKDSNGKWWIASSKDGLITNTNGNFEVIQPNGPYSNSVFRIFNFDNEMMVAAGGYSAEYNIKTIRDGIYKYTNFDWTNYNRVNGALPAIDDIVSVAKDPVSGSYILCTFGNGFIVWDGVSSYKVVNDTTSTFVWRGKTIVPNDYFITNAVNVPGSPYTRITDAVFDSKNHLWIVNYGTGSLPSIHELDNNGNWKHHTITLKEGSLPLRMTIDNSGVKWITSRREGIFVYSDSLNKQVFLGHKDSDGGPLPGTRVSCITKDKKGQLWIGTNKGIAVMYNPDNVFNGEKPETPIFGTRPLLVDEAIKTIVVDGANRKWVGTSNGIWLFNEDASKQILNWNKTNSPLPTNEIIDMGINEKTGELFIGTDIGLFSYWTDASTGGTNYNEFTIFPNPVMPDFDGYVGIQGLANNSQVKITDVAGRLIHESIANGGTAVWNVKDEKGNRAATGVYLIFCATKDGEQKFVGKVAVVK